MQRPGGIPKMTLLMKLSLTLLVMASGCVMVKYENAHDLIKTHPKGFEDAVNASDESREFVRDALKTINELEEIIESE
jgi:hypothetical protein